MNISYEEKQREDFRNILFDLAKDQLSLKEKTERSIIYKRLESLYDSAPGEKPFRHFYSDIFSVLTQIQQDSNLGDINILGQNLDLIRRGYQSVNKSSGNQTIDIGDSIRKLYDHVNLDIARIAYSDGADRRISGESSIENIQGQLNSIQVELQKAQTVKEDYEEVESKIKSVEEKLNDSQKQYITILGIFAAIVMAFTGGLTFSNSVLDNIAQASIYRTITVSLVIGLVILNVLFGLFFYVNSLVNKEGKLTTFFLSNVVIVLLLVVTFVSWLTGIVEKRNWNIENSNQLIVNELKEVQ